MAVTQYGYCAKWYNTVTVKSTCQLLMAWCLFGARSSATNMDIQVGRPVLSKVPQHNDYSLKFAVTSHDTSRTLSSNKMHTCDISHPDQPPSYSCGNWVPHTDHPDTRQADLFTGGCQYQPGINRQLGWIAASGDRFNIKMPSYQYKNSHCWDLATKMRFPILVRWQFYTESGPRI